MAKLIGSLVLLFGLAACWPQSETVEGNEPPSNYVNAAIPAEISADQCRALGGSPAGIAGQTCSFPAADAGNACNGHDDCAGACLANDASDTVGFCSAETATYGCLIPFDNGETQPPICID